MSEADLVRSADISRRVGLSPGRISSWKRDYDDFPVSVMTSDEGSPLYIWSEVQSFLLRHNLPQHGKRRTSPQPTEMVRDGHSIGIYPSLTRARVVLIGELLSIGDDQALDEADRVVGETGVTKVFAGGHIYRLTRHYKDGVS